MTTDQAIAKYGIAVCEEAFDLHQQGNGAATVAQYLNLTTRQADCAIDAGRDWFNKRAEIDARTDANWA